MSFATQGAISGNRVPNGMSIVQGTTAGIRNNAVSASKFDVKQFKENLAENMNKDVEKLNDNVEKARNADIDSLDKQYTNALDVYLGDLPELKTNVYNTEANKLKTQYDNKYKQIFYDEGIYDFGRNAPNYKMKRSIERQLDSLSYWYKGSLNNLNSSLNTSINSLKSDISKAKRMLNDKAVSDDIVDANIRSFQNSYIDSKNKLMDSYDNIYSDNLKIIQDNYKNYSDSYLSQFNGRTLYGKKCTKIKKIKIVRLKPKLKAMKKPKINIHMKNIHAKKRHR